MKPSENGTDILLSDYKPPAYLVNEVHLRFELDRQNTIVHAKLHIERAAQTSWETPLFLDGDDLTLVSVLINGQPVLRDQMTVSETGLILRQLPKEPTFTIETVVRINPEKNTQLMGLYATRNNFCTQCEAEGFRRITFFPDRPDVLAVFTVRLEGKFEETPLLLSNGNKIDQGDLGDGKHFAVWHDPFPKPAYLFAVFAGDLGVITDSFTTMSGRDVRLEIYVEHGKEERALYAMDALKRSMRWDEERFGLEYDLDIFMIVAVSDFNMGAMENKGLNIFNDKYVLADPHTATDADYANIESIIAHEYFHNWTGNRITCRDWFQLCLKEGLTVYRDHEFSSDMRSRAVKRIADVRALRAHQFPEDAGPLAHPVRPQKYKEINNFYTATVYEKGAELVRMLETILGSEGFRRGIDLYFQRHDGDAATIEQFIACFAEATDTDLSHFAKWYDYSGTPNVSVKTAYDAAKKSFSVIMQQTLRSGVPQPRDIALHIPVSFALLNDGGKPMVWDSVDGSKVSNGVLHLTESQQTIRFDGVQSEPRLSVFRGFSAPITQIPEQAHDDALFAARHDDDPFNRWNAINGLFMRTMKDAIADIDRNAATPPVDPQFLAILESVARDNELDFAYRALCLTPPTVNEIARDLSTGINPSAIHAARENILDTVSVICGETFETLFDGARIDGSFEPTAAQAGARSFVGTLLSYLVRTTPGIDLATTFIGAADNMTDKLTALSILAHQFPGHSNTIKALADFREAYASEPMVLDKWLSVQATVPSEETLTDVKELVDTPIFSWKNPNRARALLGAFATGNPVGFNRPDGEAYAFFCDSILRLDAINPQVSARLMTAMRSWKDLEPVRQAAAETNLRKLSERSELSRDLRDILSRTLGATNAH
ncbi:MAG: aminopeptidase N [Pseudomonadota bacterium]